MERELVETMFDDPSELVRFSISQEQCGRAVGDCIALLKKDGPDRWSYTLEVLGKAFVGDYLKPFEPSRQNYDTFNEGCREVARRLRVYLETMDLSLVPTDPPAFGPLTYVETDPPAR